MDCPQAKRCAKPRAVVTTHRSRALALALALGLTGWLCVCPAGAVRDVSGNFPGVLFPGGSTSPAEPIPLSNITVSAETAAPLFAALHTLGLPKVPREATRTICYVPGLQASPLLRLQSNAWMLPSSTSTQTVFLTDTGARLENDPRQAATRRDGGSREQFLAQLDEAIQETLQRQAMGGLYTDRSAWAPTVFLAAALDDIGYTNRARQVLGLALDLSQAPDEVALLCLNQLADTQAHLAAHAFQTHHDWARRADDLEQVLQRFPNGWANAAQAQTMIRLYRERAALSAPPALEPPPGMPWDPVFQAIADAMISQANTYPPPEPSAWFSGRAQTADTNSWEARVIEMGPRALVLFVALLDDPILVNASVQPRGGYSRHPRFSGSMIGGVEESLDDLFGGSGRARPTTPLPLPSRRRDIARAWLAATLPRGPEDPYGGYGAESVDVAAAARGWFARVDLDSEVTLVTDLFEQGDNQQQHAALQALLRFDRPELDAKIEARILAALAETQNEEEGMMNTYSSYQLVETYAAARSSRSKAFIERYIAAVRAGFAGSESATETPQIDDAYAQQMKSYEQQMKERVEQMLTTLEQLASAKTPTEIVDDVLAGKQEFEEAIAVLNGRLRGLDLPDRTAQALTLAERADANRELRNQLLQYVLYDVTGWSEIPPDQQEVWRGLLAQDRATPSDLPFAAFQLLMMLDSSEARTINVYRWEEPPADIFPYLLARAEAITTDQPPDAWPPIPSAANVSSNVLAEAIQSLLNTPAPQRLAQIDGWDLATRMAVAQRAQTQPFHEELNLALHPLLTRLETVDLSKVPEALRAPLESLAGEPMRVETLKQITIWMNERRDAGESWYATLQAETWLHGYGLRVAEMSEEELRYQASVPAPQTTLYIHSAVSRGQQLSTTWTAGPPEPKENPAPATKDSDFDLSELLGDEQRTVPDTEIYETARKLLEPAVEWSAPNFVWQCLQPPKDTP